MKTILTLSVMVPVLLAVGCGGSYPPPTQPMVDAQAAERSAKELGAADQPAAQLHLKLAEEQIAQAKVSMDDGDNKRADYLLVRAKADAELALALAREQGAKVEAQRAVEQANTMHATNASQGAQQ